MHEKRDINAISRDVIGAALDVHRALGPGLLESAYETCLAYELANRGLKVERQKDIPLHYKGVEMECGFRMDLLVESRVVVELKTVERFLPLHDAQLLSYLKLSGCQLGLLINFNVPLLRDGIKRVAN